MNTGRPGRSGADSESPPTIGADVVAGIVEGVRARGEEWAALTEELVRLESPSTLPETQEPVQDVLSAEFRELGYRVRRVPGRTTGGLLMTRPRDDGNRPGQLLIGHTDTVWPVGTLESMPVEREGDVLRGPGSFDMKAGLASVVVAIRTLRELGLEPSVAPVVLVNSDEEIGSPDSTRHLVRLARRVCRAFVLEPALGLEGRLKTTRKGTGQFQVRITGRGAHSGLDPERGASAIQELAFLVQDLHRLTDLERGIVVNVGEIRGGVRPNVVAAGAEAAVDVRVPTMEDARWVEERIRAIEPRVPGCRIEILGSVTRPPLEATPGNRRLWREARRVAGAMGLAVEEGRSGGASDGNTTNVYVPTLDGLGAVGDGAHAHHEHVLVERSLERCALLACLLLCPPELPDAVEEGPAPPGGGPSPGAASPGGGP